MSSSSDSRKGPRSGTEASKARAATSAASTTGATPTASGTAAPEPDRGNAELRDLAEMKCEIEARICSLHRIAGTLHDRVEGTRQEGPIALNKIEERAHYISAMRHLHREVAKLAAMISKNGMAADQLHQMEIKAVQEGLERAQSRATEVTPRTAVRDESWPPQDPARAKAPWAAAAMAAMRVPAPFHPARRMVKVVGDVAVEATVISTGLVAAEDILAAVAPGELYYVPHWNHFAVRIGQCVLHGNLGKIYRGPPPRSAGPVARDPPEHVKECHRAKCRGDAGCRYYHDPARFPGAGNVRNFMADSWLYAPSASPSRFGTRRIGSSDCLEADLRVVQVEEARQFLDQTAHDLICSIILWHYVVRPSGHTAAPEEK